MRKTFNKLFRIVFIVIVVSIIFYSEVKPNENMGRIAIVVFGMFCLTSGLLGWKCFGIRTGIRETKYGEIINKIIMTIVGIALIVESFRNI